MKTDMIKVWVNWPSGSASVIVPFWKSDEYIIRDLQEKLTWIKGPFTVERN